jgi:hypothetical protein
MIVKKLTSAFEKWQVIISATQTAILLGTLLVALYIGLKQTEISAKQTEISAKQTEISKALLDIPFTVSVEVTYDAGMKRFNIFNKGLTNLFLWGTKLGDGPRSVDKDPRLIAPGGSYYLLAPSVETDAIAKVGQNGELRGNLEIYVSGQNLTKYVVTTIVFAQVIAGACTIHTQTTSNLRSGNHST